MIVGVLYNVFPEEVHRDFHKRRFWIQELNKKYPSMYELELWHDDVYDIKQYSTGDVLECDFIVHGRLYDDNNKVKMILQCRGIKIIHKSGGSD